MRTLIVSWLMMLAPCAAAQPVFFPPYTLTVAQTSPTVVLRVQMDPVTCLPPPLQVTAERTVGGVVLRIVDDSPCQLAPPSPAERLYDVGAFAPGRYTAQFQACTFGPQGAQCNTFATLPFRVFGRDGVHAVPAGSPPLLAGLALALLALAAGAAARRIAR